MIFIDTSAFYALADRADENHKEARKLFAALTKELETLITHNYVVVESAALMQHRLGIASAMKFLTEMDHFSIAWVDQALHADSREEWQRQKRARVSFVDCVSFTLMRREGITRAFAFDKDFITAGFIFYN